MHVKKTNTAVCFLVALLLPSLSAFAVPIRMSDIQTTVTDSGGVFTYDYTVVNEGEPEFNDSEVGIWPLIIAYVLPLDDPSVVFNVATPPNWDFQFLSAADYANPFGSAFVIRWFDTDPPPGNDFEKTIAPDGFNSATGFNQHEPDLGGFGFESFMGPVDGPYLTEWLDLEPFIGDPPLPGGSVSSSASGFLPFTRQDVPEPSAALLLLAGLTALKGSRARRR